MTLDIFPRGFNYEIVAKNFYRFCIMAGDNVQGLIDFADDGFGAHEFTAFARIQGTDFNGAGFNQIIQNFVGPVQQNPVIGIIFPLSLVILIINKNVKRITFRWGFVNRDTHAAPLNFFWITPAFSYKDCLESQQKTSIMLFY